MVGGQNYIVKSGKLISNNFKLSEIIVDCKI